MRISSSRLMRYLAYSLEILVLFVLQETPGLFPEIFGGRPLLLVPVAISISMFETEIASMGFAVAIGLLMDYALGAGFGFYALVLVVLCVIISKVSSTVLQVNLPTSIITAFFAVAIVVILDWLVHFVFSGYSRVGFALVNHYLPNYLYTLLIFPLLFIINRGISHLLTKPA